MNGQAGGLMTSYFQGKAGGWNDGSDADAVTRPEAQQIPIPRGRSVSRALSIKSLYPRFRPRNLRLKKSLLLPPPDRPLSAT